MSSFPCGATCDCHQKPTLIWKPWRSGWGSGSMGQFPSVAYGSCPAGEQIGGFVGRPGCPARPLLPGLPPPSRWCLSGTFGSFRFCLKWDHPGLVSALVHPLDTLEFVSHPLVDLPFRNHMHPRLYQALVRHAMPRRWRGVDGNCLFSTINPN